MRYRIGCSGFSYKEWKDVFYPPKLSQKRWFEYYCTRFNTLELNVTFYRFPQLSFLQNWYDKAPHDFVFSVKAPRVITHYKRFIDTEQLLTDFYTTIQQGLKEKLGAVLFQLPASIEYSENILNRIIHQINPAFTNVIEFRHNSWWNNKVYIRLAEKSTVFCGVSHPKLSDDIVANTPVAYYRFHGVPKLYYSEYNTATIEAFSVKLKQLKNISRAYIYFNNTAGMGAINNAEHLKALLGK